MRLIIFAEKDYTLKYIPPRAIPPRAIPPRAIPPRAIPPRAIPPRAIPPRAIPPPCIPFVLRAVHTPYAFFHSARHFALTCIGYG